MQEDHPSHGVRDLRFSLRWRLKSWCSDFWHRIMMLQDTNVVRECRMNMEAGKSSQVLVTYHIMTGCQNQDDQDFILLIL